jgi:hypothetical protein
MAIIPFTKGKQAKKTKEWWGLLYILPYLVGQLEDFEKEVQVLEAGNNSLLSRVDEANHRVKTFQLEGNNTFLNQKRQYSFISFRELFPTVRGVLGNKCAGPHYLKTIQIREIMLK